MTLNILKNKCQYIFEIILRKYLNQNKKYDTL